MKLTIRKRNLQWSDALAQYAERRIRDGLGRVRGSVRSVFVRLADVNGPRGGEDKHCAVSVRLSTGPEVMVNTRDACPYRAVDDAVMRVRRVVSDRMKRARDRRRRPRIGQPM